MSLGKALYMDVPVGERTLCGCPWERTLYVDVPGGKHYVDVSGWRALYVNVPGGSAFPKHEQRSDDKTPGRRAIE